MNYIKPIAFAMGIAAFSGCVVYPDSYYTGQGQYPNNYPATNETVVTVAPPPPQVEMIPMAPFIGALWIAGFWDWAGGRYMWSPGHYEHGRAGYTYRQSNWRRFDNGHYRLQRGGWNRHH